MSSVPSLIRAYSAEPRFKSLTSDPSLFNNAQAWTYVADGIPIVYYGSEQGYSGGQDPLNREPLWTSGYSTSSPVRQPISFLSKVDLWLTLMSLLQEYLLISKLNRIRAQAGSVTPGFYTTKSTITASTNHDIVVRKSLMVSVLTNRGRGAAATVQVPTSAGLPPLIDVVDVLSVSLNHVCPPACFFESCRLSSQLQCKTWKTSSDGSTSVYISDGQPQVCISQRSKPLGRC